MSSILVVVADMNVKDQLEQSFSEELPEVTSHVIGVTELAVEEVKYLKPDMVVVEKGPSDANDSILIQKIRSVSKVPIVLMATENNADYIDPNVSNKYEGIYEATQKAKLPSWLKQFYKRLSSEVTVKRSN